MSDPRQPEGESKATPGPWSTEEVGANASGGFHLYVIDSQGRKIAALWGGAAEKCANGELITAAHDMRDALKTAHDALDRLMNIMAGTPEHDVSAMAQAELARRASVAALKAAGLS